MANKFLDYAGLTYVFTKVKTLISDAVSGKADSSHKHAAGDITSGTLPIARGGTGLTSSPSMLVNLASTTADTVLEASPRPGVTGTLPVANGGTGNTSVDTSPASGSTKMVTSGGVYTALSGKAPTAHASTATTYGIGTGSNYGHVKLSDSTSSTSAASAGIAASPKAVKAAYDLANEAKTAAAAAGSTIYTGTIGTTWTENEDTGVKTQTVTVSGITAADNGKLDHDTTSIDGTSDGYAAFVEEENQFLDLITNGYAQTVANGITFTIFGDAPTVSIPFWVEVC